jgi:hypothetical protein
MSAAVYISKAHAKHANLSTHSPGPVYLPKLEKSVKAHSPAPHLGSGQTDRFWNRFEQGRLG